MPKFHGKPQESVDEFIFEAKLFMNGKNIDYHHPGNQARVVAMLASNLRDGAASWYHSRIMIDNEPISSIDNLKRHFETNSFLPTSNIDKVDHFITGLKPDNRKEVDYLNCNSLKTAISAAQAYERAHFGAARRQTAARRDGPEPMDISQVTTRPTVEQCRRQGLCFYCRKPGHRISDCPKKRQGNEGAQRM
ncbi:hypothetical protein F441_02293 [Phytophthora nicotianae CJ01A1]|uniref:CCHC-type domain-containing protein n=1 Tax=Phytophthora nicotianae CJ01A1 TaxID=1317063 RepID=W2XQU7_PHYNI|nr:hypothetical protein F441_02293 [Phytophthora nicotianae CJ01A1]